MYSLCMIECFALVLCATLNMSISIIITWTKPDLVCSSLQLVVKCLRLLEVALNVLHVTKRLELFHLLGIAFQLLNETLPAQLHIRSAKA